MLQDTRGSRPTTPADLHRLADVAHERDLRLYQEHSTGAWFCTSHSNPDEVHYVTGFSCTCRGFCRHKRCTHRGRCCWNGWARLPERPAAPAPIATTRPCMWCYGTGAIPNDYRQEYESCEMCDGTGVRPARPTSPALPAAA